MYKNTIGWRSQQKENAEYVNLCLNEEKLTYSHFFASQKLLGVPFNIASYALLTLMVAQVCDLEPGEFVHTLGDAHIYNNHIEQVELQLTREPYPLPKMKINPDVKDIFNFTYEDFELVDYVAHPHIKGVVSV